MKDDSITHPLYLQIQGDIDKVEKLQTRFRSYYYWFRGSQVVLTGLITVLSGIELDSQHWILGLGATVTTLTAIETLFRFDTKKDSLSLALFDYRAIRDDFIFYNIQGNITPITEQELYERFVRAKAGHRKIISRESSDNVGGEQEV